MTRYWLCLALLTVSAHAADPAPAAPAAKEKKICTTAPSTGSHLKQRSCVTQAQHEERQKRDREAAQRLRDRQAPPPTSSASR